MADSLPVHWHTVSDGLPDPGTWCWVWEGTTVCLAQHSTAYAHGWGNEDTWEDFSGAVTPWLPIVRPEPPAAEVPHA